MWFCYLDEAGCTGVLPSTTSKIQPVFIVAGLAIEQCRIASLTTDFVKIKERFYPHVSSTALKNLDRILLEVKGADIRRDIRQGGHRRSRHAQGFLLQTIRLLEEYHAHIFGRVWVKGVGLPFDGTAVYGSSVQAICHYFQSFLEAHDSKGMIIADSRTKPQNALVSHSIFTRKYRAQGDEYERILEMPVFGHSDNHAGIQIADLLCSALLFPIAAYTYCLGTITSPHVDPCFKILKQLFGSRLQRLQYRYRTTSKKWAGGITVSDALGRRSGGLLFTP